MRMLRLLSAQAKNKQVGSFSMSKGYNTTVHVEVRIFVPRAWVRLP